MAITTKPEIAEKIIRELDPTESTAMLDEGPLTADEIAAFRQQLTQMREWLIRGIAELEERACAAISHSQQSTDDGGDDSWQQSLAQRAIADKRMQLHEVMQAFSRISQNTYGRCVAKNCLIDRAFLGELPWAKYCQACAARH